MEKRSSKRIPLQIHGAYFHEDDAVWKNCVLIDISQTGMGMMLGESFHEDSYLLFSITTPHKTIEAGGKVAWSKKLQGQPGLYNAAGIKIVGIRENDLDALMTYAEDQVYRSEQRIRHL